MEEYKLLKDWEFKVGQWIYLESLVDGCWGASTSSRIGRVIDFATKGLIHGLCPTNKGILIERPDGVIWKVNGIFRLATPEEIKAHLLKEFNQKFPVGCSFVSLGVDTYSRQEAVPDSRCSYDKDTDTFYVYTILLGKPVPVYRQGVWAMKSNGDSIEFGCAKFCKQQFEHVLEFNHSDISNRKLKSITLDSGVTIDIETIQKIVEATK